MAVTKTVQEKQLEYFTDVLLRNYCRVLEENEVMYEEMHEMKMAMAILFQESADMRRLLKTNGIEVPVSDFVPAEDLAELENRRGSKGRAPSFRRFRQASQSWGQDRARIRRDGRRGRSLAA